MMRDQINNTTIRKHTHTHTHTLSHTHTHTHSLSHTHLVVLVHAVEHGTVHLVKVELLQLQQIFLLVVGCHTLQKVHVVCGGVVWVGVYIYVCVCDYACIYVCVIRTHIHTHSHSHTTPHAQTDR
jgi:hypothetical protein